MTNMNRIEGAPEQPPEINVPQPQKKDDGILIEFPIKKTEGEESNEKAIEEIKDALITTTGVDVMKRPKGTIGNVGNQGREIDNTDGTDGYIPKDKKKVWPKVVAITTAVVVAVGGGYMAFKDTVNGWLGINTPNPNDIPPNNPIVTSGTMPSQETATVSPSGEVTVVVPEVITTPSVEVTPSASPEVSPSPSATVDQETQAEAIINQQIQDFLNFEGDFTRGKINEIAIKTINDIKETKLGVADPEPKLEGLLLDFLKKDDSLILVMGFDGADGERFVTLVEIPVYFHTTEDHFNFYFQKFLGDGVSYSSQEIVLNGDDIESKIIEQLEPLKGDVVAFSAYYEGFSEEITKQHAGERYCIEHNRKAPLGGKLISMVDFNGYDQSLLNGFNVSDFEDVQIIKIEKYEDINNVGVSDIPMMNPGIYSIKGK